jgi:DNA topoisomerase-3
LRLILCEKPSVARSIAAVLGADHKRAGYYENNECIVSWCVGHLLEFAPPEAYSERYGKWNLTDLPIVPAEWKYSVAPDKSKQLDVLCGLMNRLDIKTVINGCDSGREGELIFRTVYEYCGCKKPVERLWISSMEEAAIRDGFKNLRPGKDFDGLYRSALCRARADWLVGINATRLFSCLYGAKLGVGRVQSPTLAMITERAAAIAGFKKEKFYTVELCCEGFMAASGRIDDKNAAEAIRADCDGGEAVVKSVTRTEKSIAPPKLCDLTSLQRECNRALGYTAQQTLDYVQSLYEKKLASYPRSDSRYLTGDMAAVVRSLVAVFAPGAPCDAAQVINPSKVSDHHAVIPTMESIEADLSTLPSGERAVWDMLKTRLVCAVGEPHRYLETAVTLEAGGAEFKAKGKTVLYNGWKDRAKPLGDETDEEPPALPGVAEGRSFPVTASIKEGVTAPPKHFTEDTLLRSMETAGAEEMLEDTECKGLGTPATRASIREKLVKTGFVERSKKNLLPTEKGKNLIAVLPDALKSPALTAEWENRLAQVERGELAAAAFMDGIAEFMRAIVRDNSAPKPEFIPLFADKATPSGKALGVCPRCGGAVREGAKGFFCDNSACGFKIWKNSKFWTAKQKP